MQQQESRRSRLGVQPVKLDEVAIRRIPPFQYGRRRRLSPEQLTPQGLQVPAGNPPGGRIDYLTPRRSRSGTGWFLHYLFRESGGANWKSRSLESKRALTHEKRSDSSRSEE